MIGPSPSFWAVSPAGLDGALWKAVTPIPGLETHAPASKASAGYVALERVTARLEERSGSFVLQHSGKLGQGKQSLDIEVVADSGTGELKGISGTLEILFEKEGHAYVFDYTLPEGQ